MFVLTDGFISVSFLGSSEERKWDYLRHNQTPALSILPDTRESSVRALQISKHVREGHGNYLALIHLSLLPSLYGHY